MNSVKVILKVYFIFVNRFQYEILLHNFKVGTILKEKRNGTNRNEIKRNQGK